MALNVAKIQIKNEIVLILIIFSQKIILDKVLTNVK